MQGETQSHDICVILAETQGRCVFREIFEGHLKEVDVEFPVKVMQLIIRFAIWGIGIYLFQVVLVVGTVFVDTLPDDKELPAFDGDQGTPAERAPEFKGFVKTVIFRQEKRAAYFAQELPFGTVVFVKIIGRGIAAGTAGIT